MNPTLQMTCGSNREKTIMKTTDQAANSAHESFDTFASTTHQAAQALNEKGDPLKKAEQQLMKKSLSYVRYNPWVTQ
jgi:ElaB/YqjD/DUF883 family membrane-anchored ribosome-binding protein